MFRTRPAQVIVADDLKYVFEPEQSATACLKREKICGFVMPTDGTHTEHVDPYTNLYPKIAGQ